VSRNRFPDPDPIVGRLHRNETGPDAEDVVALVGYIGPGRLPPDADPDDPEQRPLRIFADNELSRWLDVPRGAVVDTQRVNEEDELSPSVIWVDRPTMFAEIDWGPVTEVLDNSDFKPPLSTWNLIPETPLVAASLMGMLWHGEGGDYS
jgi:hypothetical protein